MIWQLGILTYEINCPKCGCKTLIPIPNMASYRCDDCKGRWGKEDLTRRAIKKGPIDDTRPEDA